MVISSKDKMATIRRVDEEMSLLQIADTITGVDIILTEGFKRGPAPKIEVSRREKSSELLCTADELVAIATDQHFDLPVPQFGLDDAVGLVDTLERRFLRKQS